MTFYDPTLYGRDEEEEFGDSGAYSESLEEDFEEEEEEEEEAGVPEADMSEPASPAPPPPPAPKPAAPGGGGPKKPAAKKKAPAKKRRPRKKLLRNPQRRRPPRKLQKRPAKKAAKNRRRRKLRRVEGKVLQLPNTKTAARRRGLFLLILSSQLEAVGYITSFHRRCLPPLPCTFHITRATAPRIRPASTPNLNPEIPRRMK